jgi:hypothetical protein
MPVLPAAGRALASGLAGAATVNVLNETARRLLPAAPRLDLLGERGLSRLFRTVGARPPRGRALYASALAADVLANTLYYALVEAGRNPRRGWRGALLGSAAGVGAVLLPPRMGLGKGPTARTATTQALSVLWYLAGGLAAAGVARALMQGSPDR